MSAGSLTIVGTGIQAAGQITVESLTCIEHSDKLLYLVTSPITKEYLTGLNSSAESLETFYEEGKDRFVTYMEMVEHILDEVREGKEVCVAFYGHPGVFVLPSHEAIRRARDEGFHAKMLPGISAEDCLFADLGVDPALPGCQSFEATDFLLQGRRTDNRSSLILWQIGVIGELNYKNEEYSAKNLDVLAERLADLYAPDHRTILYEAAAYPMYEAIAEDCLIADLPNAHVSPISTLYVPPMNVGPVLDSEMFHRLGIDREAIHDVELRVYARQARSASVQAPMAGGPA